MYSTLGCRRSIVATTGVQGGIDGRPWNEAIQPRRMERLPLRTRSTVLACGQQCVPSQFVRFVGGANCFCKSRATQSSSLPNFRLATQRTPDSLRTARGPIRLASGGLHRVAANFRKLLDLGLGKLDFSTMPSATLIAITEDWMRRFSEPHRPTPIVAIAHTKNWTDRSSSHLAAYLTWARAAEIRFSTYPQWLDALGTNVRSDARQRTAVAAGAVLEVSASADIA